MTNTHTLPSAGTYRLEPSATKIVFETRHMFGLGRVKGEFGLVSGEIVLAEPVTSSTVRIVVDAASLSTGDSKRDAHVASGTFLGSGDHPTITFTSERLDRRNESWAALGQLSVRDLSGPLSVEGQIVDIDNAGITIRATASVDRYMYGITKLKGMAARRLHFEINAYAVRV